MTMYPSISATIRQTHPQADPGTPATAAVHPPAPMSTLDFVIYLFIMSGAAGIVVGVIFLLTGVR